jgi:hypothetical protein
LEEAVKIFVMVEVNWAAYDRWYRLNVWSGGIIFDFVPVQKEVGASYHGNDLIRQGSLCAYIPTQFVKEIVHSVGT